MYIHSYQIHNVLNAYRKQLSQGTKDNSAAGTAKKPSPKDMITISMEGQRKTLFDKISNEIVERIIQFGPETRFDGPAADPKPTLDLNTITTPKKEENKESVFTYTIIDQNNQKLTYTLPVHPLGQSINEKASLGTPYPDADLPAIYD